MLNDPFSLLRDVLLLGSLQLNVQIGSLPLVLTAPKYDIVSWASSFLEDPNERNLNIIANSVSMLRGRPVSHEDVETIETLLKHLDRPRFYRVYFYTMNLLTKMDKIRESFEPYLYTKDSRILWNKFKAKQQTGECLFEKPTNYYQTSWISWNLEEDRRLDSKEEWDRAMLLASAFNPKGVKDIRDKWYREEKELETRRENLLNSFLDKKGVFNEGRRETETERLQREFAMWVKGEEDEHDKIVRGYKEKMMRGMEEHKKREEELRSFSIRQQMDKDMIVKPLVGLTDKDLEKLRASAPPKPHITLNENRFHAETILDKYLLAQTSAGNLVEKDGQIVPKEQAQPKPTTSLMDDVLSRQKPTI